MRSEQVMVKESDFVATLSTLSPFASVLYLPNFYPICADLPHSIKMI